MSGQDEGGEAPQPPVGGRRKDGRPYREDNIREDGSYEVGKGRPPASGQFTVGDGRKRGRRAKGVQNADTEFARELSRKMVVKENGVERKVTKSHAVDLRLIDNATRKGDNRAIEMVDQRRRRIADAAELNRHRHIQSDQAILEAYLHERANELTLDPALLGDSVHVGDTTSPNSPDDVSPGSGQGNGDG